jgi:uncharacterized RDD family membrane protein YckC
MSLGKPAAGAALPADGIAARPTGTAPPAPALARRLAAFVYEGVLLFGVTMISGYLYSSLTQQRHALQGRSGLQAFLFVVLGIYFAWFWSRSGQTLAMKAWHLRLVMADGRPLSQRRALLRYLLSWLWFVPALATVHVAGLQGGAALTTLVLAGVIAYAALTRLRPDRQFWHDAVCGTRLIDWRPVPPPRAKSGG